ncbi:hypothetical protein GQ44DRAFT_436222 [Phaeosphaeriaceae sp. PMI808]|nr:hypothetical protein GQ44DRAFT_436222 [Phaeosphaeriaceae sp. PMI808]
MLLQCVQSTPRLYGVPVRLWHKQYNRYLGRTAYSLQPSGSTFIYCVSHEPDLSVLPMVRQKYLPSRPRGIPPTGLGTPPGCIHEKQQLTNTSYHVDKGKVALQAPLCTTSHHPEERLALVPSVGARCPIAFPMLCFFGRVEICNQPSTHHPQARPSHAHATSIPWRQIGQCCRSANHVRA